MKQLLMASLMGSAIALATSAMAADMDMQALEKAARAEGAVNSVGMPDSWANWKDTWVDLEKKLYGLKHMDTDMSSAQEIAKFAAEKDNATADIGDVGAAFGPIAVQQGVTQAVQTQHLGTNSGLGQGRRWPLDARLHRLHRLYRQQAAGQGRPALVGRPENRHLQSVGWRCQHRRTSGKRRTGRRSSPWAAMKAT